MEGQMEPKERALITQTVLQEQPTICVECGTWLGGGSTLAIAEALKQLGKGTLHTFEKDPEMMTKAVTAYETERPDLLSYVKFYDGDFVEGIERLGLRIDFALLDGPGTRRFNWYNVKALFAVDRLMPVGGVIIFHDWFKIKCEVVRPFIWMNQVYWKIEQVMQSTMGLAVVRKVKRYGEE